LSAQLAPHQQSPDHDLPFHVPFSQLVPSKLLEAQTAPSHVSPKIVCSPCRTTPSSSVSTDPRANWRDPMPEDRGHVCTAAPIVEIFASRAR